MRPSGYVSAGQIQQIAYTPYGNASGGSSSTITVGGQSYTLLSFTSDGTLTVNRSGLFDALLVGGGGSGSAGGGGGGQVMDTTIYLAAGSYAITIGAGGTTLNDMGVNGFSSYIGTVVYAQGGGGGGNIFSGGATARVGLNGGNGGGGGQSSVAGGSSSSGGFSGATVSGASEGGGGGGAGGNGSGKNGGAGKDISLWLGQSASTTLKAGGGAGYPNGTAGSGGGGAVGSAGTANSGGGGGGYTTVFGAGGSGIVYVRFRNNA